MVTIFDMNINTYRTNYCCLEIHWRFTFEWIHNTQGQIYFQERAENHKTKEWMFK